MLEKVNKIRKLCIDIRDAIIKLEPEELPNSSFLLRFPYGCCGDASNLLAKYLRDNNIESEYVWGMRGEQSHAWLESGELIIDITADQFPEIKEKILVTTDKSWHREFKGQRRSDGDFEKFEPYNKNRLVTIYKNILKRISENAM